MPKKNVFFIRGFAWITTALIVMSTAQSPLHADTISASALAAQLSSPQLIADYMRTHFHYADDMALFQRADYWQTPEEFLKRKQGDCEDYALFAKTLLDAQGRESIIFSVYDQSEGHTVTAFKAGDTWSYFDFEKLKTSRAKTHRELAYLINPSWTYAGMMRQEDNIGVISRKIKR